MYKKYENKWNKSIIFKVIRYVLVLYAIKTLGLLGYNASSLLTFVGILLFTWFFLDYTNEMVECTYDSKQKKYIIFFSIFFEFILLLGTDYVYRKSNIKISILQLMVLVPGIYILVYRSGLLINIVGGYWEVR